MVLYTKVPVNRDGSYYMKNGKIYNIAGLLYKSTRCIIEYIGMCITQDRKVSLNGKREEWVFPFVCFLSNSSSLKTSITGNKAYKTAMIEIPDDIEALQLGWYHFAMVLKKLRSSEIARFDDIHADHQNFIYTLAISRYITHGKATHCYNELKKLQGSIRSLDKDNMAPERLYLLPYLKPEWITIID